MKYVAYDHSYLGKVYDNKADAQRAARGIDYYFDARTGYSSAFNKEPLHSASVIEIPDEEVTVHDFLEAQKAIEKEEEKIEKEFERIRKKRLEKYEAIKSAYINNNTPYNYNDTIIVTLRSKNGRKKTVKGVVYGVYVNEQGEIRPSIRGEHYSHSDHIVSIEVLERFDFISQVQRVVCQNCIHFKGTRYQLGICNLHNKNIYALKENEPCYVRDENKSN